jgi:hypothetical protein
VIVAYLLLAACVAVAFGVPLHLVANRRSRPRKPRLEVLSGHCADAAFRDRAREDARRRA